eukprot:3533644-Rhodomonas_salina.1
MSASTEVVNPPILHRHRPLAPLELAHRQRFRRLAPVPRFLDHSLLGLRARLRLKRLGDRARSRGEPFFFVRRLQRD